MYYLPGIPEIFKKVLQLHVTHFVPESITLRGEGIFPRVCLDLPRDLGKSSLNIMHKNMPLKVPYPIICFSPLKSTYYICVVLRTQS